MKFSEVIGQEKVIEQLKKEWNLGRAGHARLFIGKEGVGKLALALSYVQYINCKQKVAGDSCGVCSSCNKIQKLIHPDVHFVFPVVKQGSRKAVCDYFIEEWRAFVQQTPYVSVKEWYKHIGVENKQGLIYAEESNEIIRKMSMKSYEAEYKTVIVWLPEKMQVACANKLLKLLEEPPPKTFFFLLTEQPEEVLGTIYSRTQLLKIPPIEKRALHNHIAMQFNSNIANEIVDLADGSVTEAVRLVEEQDNLNFNFEQFVRLMRLSYMRNYVDLLGWSEQIATIGREQQKQFLDYAIRMVRENFIYNLQENLICRLSETERKFTEKFAPYVNNRNVEDLQEIFQQAYYDIERNGNARIIFMDLTIQILRKIRA